MKNKEIEIFVEQDKISILGLIIRTLLIIVIFYLLVLGNIINPETKTIFNDPYIKWVMGFSWIILVVFFIFDVIKFIKSNKEEKQIGLLINRRGITNFHTLMNEVGLIPWNDIEFIGTKGSLSGTFLIIKVKNPDDYIQKAESFELKKLLRNNRTKYETPIAILINGLDISADELRKKAKIEFVKYKKW